MKHISNAVIKVDHTAKVRGEAKFLADLPMDGVLHGGTLRSAHAKARIVKVTLPPLPPGYIYADHRDIPGVNGVQIIGDDTPVFVADTAQFIGDPIGMLAGPNLKKVKELVAQIQVEYEVLEPVLNPESSQTVFYQYAHEKGNIEDAFSKADKIYEETFHTGYQEHAYLETNGILAIPEGDSITLRGSMQCPYYIHKAAVHALGMEKEHVKVIQEVTGGGFGGKEDFPSILAVQVAVTAKKAGKPVCVIYDRREDMETSSKRHPTRSRYRAAVKDGKVTALDVDLLYNAGAYTTISMVVLQRGVICANGAYHIPNLRVNGRSVQTNTVPCGAFRGFGAPQIFFAIEMFMAHIGKDLGLDPQDFKLAHFSKGGEETSTRGKYHFPVPLVPMAEKLLAVSNYHAKRKAYAVKTPGRYRGGIGLSYSFHGAGFTGTGERDIIKAKAALQKHPDDKVEILTANTEMGQGLFTAFTKIVAEELQLPLSDIIITLPDTSRVPDSGPTVASRSVMVVGELLRRAAKTLKSQWQAGVPQYVEEEFQQPDFQIPFNYDDFSGDAYPTYSWGAHAVELEIDTYTGEHKVLGAWGVYDVGTPIDETVVMGQMEGGFLQGIGYAHMEQMQYDKKGRIRSVSFSDYVLPTACDVPHLEMHLHVEEYPEGPFGAKGAGELPIVGVAPAYLNAIEQALGKDFHHIPISIEDTQKSLREDS